MRQLVVALVLAASVAHAEPSKHDKLDISDAIGNVDVLRDATGRYYVLPKVYDSGDTAQKWTFYGDGRTMYLQRIIAFSISNGDVTVSAWSQRTRGMQQAQLQKRQDGTISLICRMKNRKFERSPLTLVADDAAAKLLKSATFLPPLWERRVHFFGRGEGTTYFLVDVLQDEYGGGGYRLWKGEKGRMKQVAISDVTSDAAGTVLLAKTGELQISKDAVTWKQGKTTTAVTRLDPATSSYLIYRELGVYGQLGTFCEDQ